MFRGALVATVLAGFHRQWSNSIEKGPRSLTAFWMSHRVKLYTILQSQKLTLLYIETQDILFMVLTYIEYWRNATYRSLKEILYFRSLRIPLRVHYLRRSRHFWKPPLLSELWVLTHVSGCTWYYVFSVDLQLGTNILIRFQNVSFFRKYHYSCEQCLTSPVSKLLFNNRSNPVTTFCILLSSCPSIYIFKNRIIKNYSVFVSALHCSGHCFL